MQQLAQAERARAEGLRAELTRSEQQASAERTRAEAALADLAKVQQLAQAERARADRVNVAAAKPEPRTAQAKAESPVQPAKVIDALSANPDPGQSVASAIASWARAWSKKDVDAYLSAYAKDFTSDDGKSQEKWERIRRERIVGKSWIDVKIRDLQISIEGSIAKARFVQEYRSDRWNESGRKKLTLIHDGGSWLIKQEQ